MEVPDKDQLEILNNSVLEARKAVGAVHGDVSQAADLLGSISRSLGLIEAYTLLKWDWDSRVGPLPGPPKDAVERVKSRYELKD